MFLLLLYISSMLKPLKPPKPLAAQVGTYLVSIWHAPRDSGGGVTRYERNILDGQ